MCYMCNVKESNNSSEYSVSDSVLIVRNSVSILLVAFCIVKFVIGSGAKFKNKLGEGIIF